MAPTGGELCTCYSRSNFEFRPLLALRIQAVYLDMKLGHGGSSWGASSNSLRLIVKRGQRRDSRKVRPLCHVWAFYRSQRIRFEETAHWALRVGKVSILWEVIQKRYFQVQLFGRKWKPLKRPEAVCLGCSGRFVGHCKLTARSYLGEYFLRLEYGADRYIWEQQNSESWRGC